MPYIPVAVSRRALPSLASRATSRIPVPGREGCHGAKMVPWCPPRRHGIARGGRPAVAEALRGRSIFCYFGKKEMVDRSVRVDGEGK